MSFYQELKRRNVVKVAVLYVIASWLLLQVTDVLSSLLTVPDWTGSLVVLMLLLGFFPVLIFSWVYEMTPEGLKKEKDVDRSQSITPETGRKINILIIVMLAMAIGAVALDRLIPETEESAEKESPKDPDRVAAMESSNLAARKFAGPPVIAVLPFQAAGSDDGGFLAGGLHDDLLTRLAKLNAFKVISRTSMMEYADTTKNMRQIGDELGAGYILEGGVQARGTRVRINAQLIDADADDHLWAETYDKELTPNNLFDVQAELAAAIANALQTELSSEELALVSDMPTENMAAYNAYLRGLHTYEAGGYVGTASDREAVAAFEEAVRLDPEFAVAWAGLATARVRGYCCEYEPEQSAAALEALDKARTLQPGLLESELAWAEYQYRVRNDYSPALATLEAVQEQVAGNVYALQLMAWLNRRLGRYDVAYRTLQAARRLQPRSPSLYIHLIHYAWLVDDCASAGDYADQLLSLGPLTQASRIYVANYEMECNGDTERVMDLARGLDFSVDGDFSVFFNAAFAVRDQAFLLSLFGNENLYPNPDWQFWRQLGLADVYVTLQPNETMAESALNRAAELLNDYGTDVAKAESASFAAMNASYLSRAGEAAETRHWIEEHQRRFHREFKGDVAEEDKNHFFYAWYYAQAGLHDEAIEELRVMVEQPGGYRFPYVSSLPVFDVLKDHPAYISLQEQFGGRTTGTE
jgi:TolB-like protein